MRNELLMRRCGRFKFVVNRIPSRAKCLKLSLFPSYHSVQLCLSSRKYHCRAVSNKKIHNTVCIVGHSPIPPGVRLTSINFGVCRLLELEMKFGGRTNGD